MITEKKLANEKEDEGRASRKRNRHGAPAARMLARKVNRAAIRRVNRRAVREGLESSS